MSLYLADVPATVDFETEAIGPRPGCYPPKPVGVAIRYPNGQSRYLAWGHPTENNCTFEYARNELWAVWCTHTVLCHNAAFDFEVAHKWFGFPMPRRWHDTYFSLFLCYPHAYTYALKPTAEWMLSEPPTEQDHLRDWILANVPEATRKTFGAYICKAPAGLVGIYAIGDVNRTFDIHAKIYPHVEQTMLAPYEREKSLMPIFVNASRRGIRVDRALLSMWQEEMAVDMLNLDSRIRSWLNRNLSVDSNEEVADAIEAAGLLRPEGWVYTASGKRSTSKQALAKCVTDHRLVELLAYRNTAATLLRTFITGWLDASSVDGRLHCQWHQTRSDDGGARTGRPSSSNPNLANVPNPQDKVKTPMGFSPLPNLRRALLPEPGHVWVSADYQSQELRIMAHFEGGGLAEAYRHKPTLDMHDHARLLIHAQTGLTVDRKSTKTIGFAILYGAGDKKLAEQLGVTPAEAAQFRKAYMQAMPAVQRLQTEATQRWARGQPIRTFGGRIVPPQPPSIVKGKRVTWEYKALNMLIQGSAADQTKEAIVRLWREAPGYPLLSTLYDEINVSVPEDEVEYGVEALESAMSGVPGLDVPFAVDVECGPTWGSMSPYYVRTP